MLGPSKTVLHIAETAQGGVGTYIDMLTRLERESFCSIVVLPDRHQGMLEDQTPRMVFRYPRRSVLSTARMIVMAIRARFRHSPDIVFCHSTFALIALLVLRPISPRSRFIYCPHGWSGAREVDNSWKSYFGRRIEGALCGLAHCVVNVSQGDLNFAKVQGYYGRHIVIENAVFDAKDDLAPIDLGEAKDPIRLLFVGRLDRQKGLDILLPAFEQARLKNPALELHVVGEAVVERDTERHETWEGVRFHGWVSAEKIDAYYRAADVVVIPSRWEGLPLVLLEALRNGTPVLVSDRSEMPSLIEPEISGFVAPLNVDGIAAKLTDLRQKNLRAMHSACLNLFKTRYSSAQFARRVHTLYNELLVQ